MSNARIVAEPMWFSVETPSVYREHRLPADSQDWSEDDERKFSELEDLAVQHQTYVHRSRYQRG